MALSSTAGYRYTAPPVAAHSGCRWLRPRAPGHTANRSTHTPSEAQAAAAWGRREEHGDND